MNLKKAIFVGVNAVRRSVNWLWGWGLFAEAYFWQFLGNRTGEGSEAQIWMIARSFRTAVAGANRITGGMFEKTKK